MPLLSASSYAPPWLLRNGHIQSILPMLVRRITSVRYRRERIETPDDDFLDLDWSRSTIDPSAVAGSRVAIVSHGLEGDSKRPYVLGMVRALNHCGWDAVAWNFRGCSGEPNRRLRFYHSGDTQDLATVVNHVLATGKYSILALIGFSMGGNITLKYLGELGPATPSQIAAAVVFSVPCDLAAAADAMGRPANAIYMRRFLRMLHQKIRQKMKLFPGAIDDRNYRSMRTFKEFDDRYTAPIFGFKNAEDYWHKCSSKPLLPDITVPVLLVNAADDPFLAPACYPVEAAIQNPNFFLEVPAHGGHVGFMPRSYGGGSYWPEQRAMDFLTTRDQAISGGKVTT